MLFSLPLTFWSERTITHQLAAAAGEKKNFLSNWKKLQCKKKYNWYFWTKANAYTKVMKTYEGGEKEDAFSTAHSLSLAASFSWIYCISLLCNVHIVEKADGPYVKHFKRDFLGCNRLNYILPVLLDQSSYLWHGWRHKQTKRRPAWKCIKIIQARGHELCFFFLQSGWRMCETACSECCIWLLVHDSKGELMFSV